MKELIERDAAIECAIDAVDDWDGGWNPNRETVIRKYFEEVPVVDAVPVRHGRWVNVLGYATPGGDPVWKCSECGKGVHVYGIEHGSYGAEIADGQWVSCPNCGARMDGDAK